MRGQRVDKVRAALLAAGHEIHGVFAPDPRHSTASGSHLGSSTTLSVEFGNDSCLKDGVERVRTIQPDRASESTERQRLAAADEATIRDIA